MLVNILSAQPISKKLTYNKLEVITNIKNFSIYRNGIKCKNPAYIRLGDAVNIYVMMNNDEANSYLTVILDDNYDFTARFFIKRNSKIKIITDKNLYK